LDLPKVTIGGEEITLPAIMNFATLKRCWPAITAFDGAADDISRVSSALAFLAMVLAEARPDLTPHVLEQRLRVQRFDPDAVYRLEVVAGADGQPRSRFFDGETDVTFGDPKIGRDERPGVLAAVSQLLRASGLVATGQAQPAGETKPAEAPPAETTSSPPGPESLAA
jgi:hypothetical protein